MGRLVFGHPLVSVPVDLFDWLRNDRIYNILMGLVRLAGLEPATFRSGGNRSAKRSRPSRRSQAEKVDWETTHRR
jgi:hypothetical protein